MRRASVLLVTNLQIVLPGLVLGTLATLVGMLLSPRGDDVTSGNLLQQFLVLAAQTIATILSIAYTTGMVNAAWERGRSRFADGLRAFLRDGSHVFVALVILAVLGTAAAALSPFTFGLSILLLAFFFVYAMPAAVVGERGGLRAVVESCEIAIERALPTSLMIAAIAVIVFVVGALVELLGAVPLVGPIVQQIVVQTVIVYAMLVIVGEYRQLRLPEEQVP